MPIDYRFPWSYEPKSRTVQDADSCVIAVLGGNSPERDDRGRFIASISVLCEALQEIGEGWLSGPERHWVRFRNDQLERPNDVSVTKRRLP